MIARGIVEKIYEPNKVAVRIPVFDKSSTSNSRTPTDQLGVASICVLPNCIPNVRVGDLVYVGFENNDVSSPVIIGYMYIDKDYLTKQGLSANSLVVDSSAILPEQTTIGNVTAQEIQCLSGMNTNIQAQILYILEEIEKINNKINS